MSRHTRIERYRNIGIMAHIDAGKTTLTERILFFTGRIHSVGEVHDGSTEMDWLPQEKQRGITITSAATTAFWQPRQGMGAGVPHRINVLDTPGHVDFTIEVERSLRALDGAVAVFDASQGVEPQSEAVWRQADRYSVPRIAFINKMDKVGADFAMSVASIQARLGARPVAVQWPLGEGSEFRGLVDLVRMRAVMFDGEDGSFVDGQTVPEAVRAEVEAQRLRLIEACADEDATVLEKFVDGRLENITTEDLERALRSGTLARTLVPVLCGSAFKKKGVQMLLDAIVNYLPAPSDMPAVEGFVPGKEERVSRPISDSGPPGALAFKLMSDKAVGSIVFLRVYSGTLRAGTVLLNPATGRRERVGRLMFMHANRREEVAEVHAGDICAALGLKGVRTGDTLCDPAEPMVLESLGVMEPVVQLAVEARSPAELTKLEDGLHRLAAEDPSLRVGVDPESGQVLLSGMGELHLEVVVDRLRTEHGVEARVGQPKVAWRDTLRRQVRQEYRHVRQSGGPGQYAYVVLDVGPAPRGAGLVFKDDTRGGTIPKELVPAIEKGVAGAMARGVRDGVPLVDVEVRLLDGDTHVRDSTPQAFAVAGSLALQAAAHRAGVQQLEPVMEVEVTTPEEYLGEVLGDLAARRGRVLGMEARGVVRLVSARVPMASLFGYVTGLRGRTQGRAQASMRLGAYEPVPEALQASYAAEARA
uniref:Elongation factor G n=1 Tax=Myxococcus xanthus TaxID=34 RepID=A0A1P8VQA5_MYXXA|nr:elongation factor G [Myxococcus xanthus]